MCKKMSVKMLIWVRTIHLCETSCVVTPDSPLPSPSRRHQHGKGRNPIKVKSSQEPLYILKTYIKISLQMSEDLYQGNCN